MLMLTSVAVLLGTLLITGGSAQSISNATCLPSFGWANNSLGQSPCLVAAYLQGACQGGVFTMPALLPGQHYTGPTKQNVNQCQCSTVLYSVVSACGACQSRSYSTWSGWSTNCSNIYPSIFPVNIPTGTAVPGWAYLDVTTGDGFNAAAAQRDSNAPESTGTTIPAGTLTGTATSTTTSTATSSATSPSSLASASAAVSSKSSSNAGAIAGGVVGGVAGLAILAGLAFWFLHHRQPRPPPRPTPATYGVFNGSTEPSVGAMGQRVFSPTPTVPTMSSQPRHYDTPDPGPVPGSPVATTDMYTTYSAYQGSAVDHLTSPDLTLSQEAAPEI